MKVLSFGVGIAETSYGRKSFDASLGHLDNDEPLNANIFQLHVSKSNNILNGTNLLLNI